MTKKNPKGFALKLLACREVLARCERDLGREQTDHVADLFCDQEVVNSLEQALQIKSIIMAERAALRDNRTSTEGPITGIVKMRYPGNDPENGPAYKQMFNGRVWVCAEHNLVEQTDDELDDNCRYTGKTYTFMACRHCGQLGE